MPKPQVPRYKTIRCRTCRPPKVIRRFDRSKFPGYSVSASVILAAIRKHYKRYHPGKFREQIKKALKTKRKRGIINKKRR